MLELCFDDSTRGALKCAQHCTERVGPGVFAVCAAGEDGRRLSFLERRRAVRRLREEQAERQRHAVPLGGVPEDVLALSLRLDQGDIRAPLAQECPRKELLRRWYGREHEEALEKSWRDTLTTLARLRSLEAGETVRIWASLREPHAACGLLYAAELLRDTAAEVHAVFLPPWREREDGTVVRYKGWGEVHPEEFGHFLPLEQTLSPNALRMLADRWRELKGENAPLRAVVNGEVRSVEESFYDGMIRRRLPEGDGETTVARLIGEVLGRERPGIGDAWLADRIRWMLESGELRMVREDPERFYRSVIRRGEGPGGA